MSALLQSLPGAVAGALDALLMGPATLRKPGARTADGRGGFTTGAATDHACRGIVTEYRDAIRALSGGAIGAHDRKVLLLGASLPAGIIPGVGDAVAIGGRDWRVIAVRSDPAGATYTLQVRPE